MTDVETTMAILFQNPNKSDQWQTHAKKQQCTRKVSGKKSTIWTLKQRQIVYGISRSYHVQSGDGTSLGGWKESISTKLNKCIIQTCLISETLTIDLGMNRMILSCRMAITWPWRLTVRKKAWNCSNVEFQHVIYLRLAGLHNTESEYSGPRKQKNRRISEDKWLAFTAKRTTWSIHSKDFLWTLLQVEAPVDTEARASISLAAGCCQTSPNQCPSLCKYHEVLVSWSILFCAINQ